MSLRSDFAWPFFLTFILCTDGTESRYATVLRTTLRTMVNLSKLASFLTHLEVETILLGCRLDLSLDFNMVRHIAQQPRRNFGRFALLQSYSPAFSFYSIVAYHKFHIWSIHFEARIWFSEFSGGKLRFTYLEWIDGILNSPPAKSQMPRPRCFNSCDWAKGHKSNWVLWPLSFFWVPYNNQQAHYSH